MAIADDQCVGVGLCDGNLADSRFADFDDGITVGLRKRHLAISGVISHQKSKRMAGNASNA